MGPKSVGSSNLSQIRSQLLFADQKDHTWSRALLRLSLSDSWSASDAPLELVTNDTSPATALGALWSSADGSRLFYWGGQASDSPDEDPPEPELWSFDVSSEEWETVDVSGDSVSGIAEASVGFVSVPPFFGHVQTW